MMPGGDAARGAHELDADDPDTSAAETRATGAEPVTTGAGAGAQGGDVPTSTPSKANPGRRAMVWSFFVPPLGAVLGMLALRKLPRDESNRSARSEARVAILNGVVSTLIIVKLIYVLVHLRDWMESWLYGGVIP